MRFMKMIKRLTTILFAIMMVLMTTTMVFADEPADTAEGVSPTNKGTIKITNAIKDQEYKVYKIFDLESYSGTNYSYKVVDKWTNFFARGGEGYGYITLDDDGYIKSFNLTERNAPGFARSALVYAQNVSNGVSAITSTPTITDNVDGTQTITYSDVDMGYYLVDSSVGALCSLNTTNLTATITEKNSVPTVEKKVKRTDNSAYDDYTNADMGRVLEFKITITVGDGPQNYVLHDFMDEGLTYDKTSLEISYQLVVDGPFYNLNNTNYSTPTVTDGHTFDVVFNQTFLDNLKKDYKILVKYKATLNEKAKTQDKNYNKTWVSYGDNKNSNEDSVYIQTFRIPVFKYYKPNATVTETPLAGVKFKLSNKSNADLNNDTDFIKFVYDSTDTTYGSGAYRKALDSDATTTIEVVSDDKGYATFKGLQAGDYYLYETEAPKGFNKLTKPIRIVIQETGLLYFGKLGDTPQLVRPYQPVKIENKTGTVLPSTGGVGTTMMYIVGVALLIGSGVLLITKKNMK